MTRSLDIITTCCIGLLIGTELAVSAFINPILYRLEPSAGMSAIRLFARKLGTVMPFWYVGSLLLLLIETVIRRHEAHTGLLMLASGLWVIVILLTVLFLVPINNRLAEPRSDASLEAEFRQHRKWDTMHRYRVAALTIAMLCFLVATAG